MRREEIRRLLHQGMKLDSSKRNGKSRGVKDPCNTVPNRHENAVDERERQLTGKK